jgi:hypothetical protein
LGKVGRVDVVAQISQLEVGRDALSATLLFQLVAEIVVATLDVRVSRLEPVRRSFIGPMGRI